MGTYSYDGESPDRTKEFIVRLERMAEHVAELEKRIEGLKDDNRLMHSMLLPVFEELTDEQAVSLLSADDAVYHLFPKSVQDRPMVKDYMLYTKKL